MFEEEQAAPDSSGFVLYFKLMFGEERAVSGPSGFVSIESSHSSTCPPLAPKGIQ